MSNVTSEQSGQAGALFELLPFSAPLDADCIRSAVDSLAESLDLPPQVELLNRTALSALSAESHFRRSWWFGAPDPFRDALHRSKARMHQVPGIAPALSKAWSGMAAHVQGPIWREHIRRVSLGLSDIECRYLRRAVRFAQQLWSRAIRWSAALPGEPNPFWPLVQLVVCSTWPVGFRNGAIQLINAKPGMREDAATANEVFEPATGDQERGLFLSGPFLDDFTKTVHSALTQRNIPVVHGRVDESKPPEQQLGSRIKHLSACIAVVRQYDADFGLPWWTFQELDFAAASRRPVAVVHGDRSNTSIEGFPTFAWECGTIEEDFWTWLDATCGENSETDGPALRRFGSS